MTQDRASGGGATPRQADQATGRSAAPHQFTTTGVVDSPVKAVWAIVGDFGGLMKWHPGVSSVGMDGSGIGARRTVALGGRQIVEQLDDFDDERHTLSYRVVEGRPMSIGMSGRISLEAVDDDQTLVTWVTNIPDRPGAAELATELAGYYETRVQHMREAVVRYRTAR